MQTATTEQLKYTIKKRDFKEKNVIKDNIGYFITIEGLIHENINTYVSTATEPQNT